MTTRYEFSYGGDKMVRIRFVDVESGNFQDYVFERKEFTEFIDNAFYTLVETGGMTEGLDSDDDGMVD